VIRNNKTADQTGITRVSARVYRAGRCIGMVEHMSGFTAAQLRGYQALARYGAIKVNGRVVIDAQYR
jgi:hypothetical protein